MALVRVVTCIAEQGEAVVVGWGIKMRSPLLPDNRILWWWGQEAPEARVHLGMERLVGRATLSTRQRCVGTVGVAAWVFITPIIHSWLQVVPVAVMREMVVVREGPAGQSLVRHMRVEVAAPVVTAALEARVAGIMSTHHTARTRPIRQQAGLAEVAVVVRW